MRSPDHRPRAVAVGVLTVVAALGLGVVLLGRGVPKDPVPPPVLSEATAPSVVRVISDGSKTGPGILLYVTEDCPYCREELLRWRRVRVREGALRMVVIAPTLLPDSLQPHTAIAVADPTGILARELGVRAVPSLFVVDTGGAVIQSRAGLTDLPRIDSLLHSSALELRQPLLAFHASTPLYVPSFYHATRWHSVVVCRTRSSRHQKACAHRCPVHRRRPDARHRRQLDPRVRCRCPVDRPSGGVDRNPDAIHHGALQSRAHLGQDTCDRGCHMGHLGPVLHETSVSDLDFDTPVWCDAPGHSRTPDCSCSSHPGPG